MFCEVLQSLLQQNTFTICSSRLKKKNLFMAKSFNFSLHIAISIFLLILEWFLLPFWVTCLPTVVHSLFLSLTQGVWILSIGIWFTRNILVPWILVSVLNGVSPTPLLHILAWLDECGALSRSGVCFFAWLKGDYLTQSSSYAFFFPQELKKCKANCYIIYFAALNVISV